MTEFFFSVLASLAASALAALARWFASLISARSKTRRAKHRKPPRRV